ncbi:DUF1007 family protein [Aurantimonas sp. HBX-1]|uniref:DUF1007 family protein n=1 Tax=Aurantimonas sp. HBX-1 TaxID=2906072 RepID=UPI001F405C46|nr:DUF1007 family protein [Aurantimonas sp. HBX-1]UIJ72761.1 DUF1007 family protein [Aurantimonas sp. HBX-1]
MNQRRMAGAAALIAIMGTTAPALAHPHVFAEAKVEIVGTPDARLAAIRNVWRMDELFSSSVLVDFDKNANGTLDQDELVEIGATVKESIAEWDFYTFVETAGRAVKMSPPDVIHTLYEDGQLLMFFEMRAAEPVDLAAGKLTVANFDDTFFVAFDVASEADFQLIDMPKQCTKQYVVPDADVAAQQWMDSVASLGPDESIPEDGINYSQALATRIEVSCGPAS